MSDKDFSHQLRNLINSIVLKYKDFALFGDFNCNPLKSSVIDDICDTYDLSNLIKDLTCTKKCQTDIARCYTCAQQTLILRHNKFMLSDFHNIIGAATRRHAPTIQRKQIYYRSFKNFVDEISFIFLVVYPCYFQNLWPHQRVGIN